MSMRKEVKRFTIKGGTVSVIVSESLLTGKADVILYQDSKRGCFTDYPIQYNDGHIAYNFPERIPAYAKLLVSKAYKWINQNYPVRYTLSPAYNQPDKDQWFVTCDRADMQPHLCDSVLVKNFWEAVETISYHAAKCNYASIEICWVREHGWINS